MAGRPDMVDRGDSGLRVVDLKTGVRQSEVTQAQRQQLLFYCALMLHAVGELPAEAVVRDAAGEQWSIEFNADDVAAEERRAEEALAALQEAETVPLEARPSQSACGTCPFRLICGPFLEAYDPVWRVGRVRVGRVVGVTESQGVRSSVDIEVEEPGWAIGPLRLVGVAIADAGLTGERWGFSDFEGHGSSGLARWNTLSARW